MSHVAVVGGGWAGLSAACVLARRGVSVTVYEASRQWGGRARALTLQTPGGEVIADNGQHILIGAYTATLGLMAELGVDLPRVLCRLPLALTDPQGQGLQVPAIASAWPGPWNALAAIASARGWSAADKAGLLAAALRWRLQGFRCEPDRCVDEWAASLPARVRRELIEPLCVSALNTPPRRASAAMFLRVLRDALFGPGHGPYRGADLLLPRSSLGALLPTPALRLLERQGAALRPGQRVLALQALPPAGDTGDTRDTGARWRIVTPDDTQVVDQVILACPATEAARLLESSLARAPADPGDPGTAAGSSHVQSLEALTRPWCAQARSLAHEPIATVYTWHPGATLRWPGHHPLLRLDARDDADAQFVFHRGLLMADADGQAATTPSAGALLAWVASASPHGRDRIEAAVRRQAQVIPGLADLQVVRTVIEKRATFACTPGLQRPPAAIATGLWAAGDHVQGPYPATLEGAVRSGLFAAEQVCRALGA